jgi:hypothetical protein
LKGGWWWWWWWCVRVVMVLVVLVGGGARGGVGLRILPGASQGVRAGLEAAFKKWRGLGGVGIWLGSG